MHKDLVYIALGSNQGDSETYLRAALADMDNLEGTKLLKTSSMYISTPMGRKDQPDYINAVCLLETTLAPHKLLNQLQAIESRHGRVRSDDRWGPRTLDLDILLIGDQVIDTPDLVVPHYGMAEREFVLVPLFELAPNMIMPDSNPLSVWVAKCTLEGLRRVRTSN